MLVQFTVSVPAHQHMNSHRSSPFQAVSMGAKRYFLNTSVKKKKQLIQDLSLAKASAAVESLLPGVYLPIVMIIFVNLVACLGGAAGWWCWGFYTG